jgi:ATP phosphoribosyltransferase regulatory subunit
LGKNKILRIPYGTKDLLPGEAKVKRNCENEILKTFENWGYDEVETPTFEYMETFEVGNVGDTSGYFKLIDRNNETLLLRSDMTTPIARLVATRLPFSKHSKVKRISYVGNVFNHEDLCASKNTEFAKAGVELFGAPKEAADAEVIALAIASLKAAGLENFTISLGHIDFLLGLIESAGLEEEKVNLVKDFVIAHDAVGLEKLLEELAIPLALKKIFNKLLFLNGTNEMLKDLLGTIQNEKSIKALHNLLAIYELAKAYGVDKYIRFDLSLIREYNYYTGMVFEGYTAGIGEPICGGGRYDNMMTTFKKPCAAVGFSMNINLVLNALKGKKAEDEKDFFFVNWSEGGLVKAIKEAQRLRDMGKKVKVALKPISDKESECLALLNDTKNFIYIEGEDE